MDQIFLGNRYELQEEIGSGGMAHVFKARDTLLDRIVAIKILKPEFTEDTQFIERFRVEAKAAASLSNSSIVMIYDVGQDDGIYYIIMEYVDGITLKEYISGAGRLPWKESVTLAVQMTQAIEIAHSNSIIHRDIKPQNVLMTRDRKIKITDFGIARAASSTTITTVGNAMGSVHYFSPEQAKGALTDEKSDIYSMGITLFEMLTGVVPFEGETPIAVALKHIQEPAPGPSSVNPQVPPGLDAIVLKAIAKDKFDRYQSMGEMLADLKKVIKDPSGKSLQFAALYTQGGGNWDDAGDSYGQDDQYGGGAVSIYGGAGAYNQGNTGAYPNGGAGAYNQGNTGAFPGGAGPYNPGNTGAFPNGAYGGTYGNLPVRPGSYQRDGNYRDVRYEPVPYNPNAYNNGQYDQDPYYGRDGYPQPEYKQDGAYNAADRNYQGGYRGDGYDDGYAEGGMYDDGYRAAPPAGGRRRRGGGSRARGEGPPRRRDNYGAAMDGGRRGGGRGGRGDRGGRSGHNGVFIAVVLVAVLAAILFVVYIMNYLFNIIPTPNQIGANDDDFAVGQYVGRDYEEVKEELRLAGIKSSENRVLNDVVAEGVIFEQSVERGRIIKRNGAETIMFEVSAGAKRFTVPDYRDFETDCRAAEAELKANSLNVTISDEQNSSVPKGNVIRTEPGAGSQLAAGAKITIYRSLGSEVNQATVPSLIGKSYREALDLIENARLVPGNLTPSEVYAQDIVIRQSHAPNSLVEEGVAIDLWFDGSEPATTETETETTTVSEPETTPEPTVEPTPTPGETPEPETTPEAGETTTTEAATTTTRQSETTTTAPIMNSGEPVSMTISLTLPAERTYDENIKVLVEATPSDTGRTTKLRNRTFKRDDFPINVDFTIPLGGNVELKVYYDGELMQTKVFDENN